MSAVLGAGRLSPGACALEPRSLLSRGGLCPSSPRGALSLCWGSVWVRSQCPPLRPCERRCSEHSGLVGVDTCSALAMEMLGDLGRYSLLRNCRMVSQRLGTVSLVPQHCGSVPIPPHPHPHGAVGRFTSQPLWCEVLQLEDVFTTARSLLRTRWQNSWF